MGQVQEEDSSASGAVVIFLGLLACSVWSNKLYFLC